MADVQAQRRHGLELGRLAYSPSVAAMAPLVLRLGLGAIFAAHGAQKLINLSGASAGFEAMGFSPGTFWAVVAGGIELGGGAALIAGFLTRWAAIALAGMQLAAMIVVHLPNGFFLSSEPGRGNGIEFNVALLSGLFALMLIGSGRAGVDALVRRRAD